MAAIKKFNKYCQELDKLYNPAYVIPLPTPLLTKLTELRNDQSLCQDVWISPFTGEIPRWLENVDVCDGIRRLLKCKHCHEEWRRLGMEADNMCHWFGLESCAVELALRQPASMSFDRTN